MKQGHFKDKLGLLKQRYIYPCFMKNEILQQEQLHINKMQLERQKNYLLFVEHLLSKQSLESLLFININNLISQDN